MEVCKRACYFSFQHQTRQFLRPRRRALRRLFHASAPRAAVKPFLLADIGEGVFRFPDFLLAWGHLSFFLFFRLGCVQGRLRDGWIADGMRIGIKEVQIIQWFVQPGARVEQFDKLCEVQSDKAATEVGCYVAR
jgi:hypothetical protein